MKTILGWDCSADCPHTISYKMASQFGLFSECCLRWWFHSLCRMLVHWAHWIVPCKRYHPQIICRSKPSYWIDEHAQGKRATMIFFIMIIGRKVIIGMLTMPDSGYCYWRILCCTLKCPDGLCREGFEPLGRRCCNVHWGIWPRSANSIWYQPPIPWSQCLEFDLKKNSLHIR